MALGKAYIEVHADTKPFARELGRELDKIIRAADKEVKVSARKTGSKISEGIGEGVNKDKKKLGKKVSKSVESSFVDTNIFARISKGLIDTIDDGLSGLPAELKVLLGGALIVLALSPTPWARVWWQPSPQVWQPSGRQDLRVCSVPSSPKYRPGSRS